MAARPRARHKFVSHTHCYRVERARARTHKQVTAGMLFCLAYATRGSAAPVECVCVCVRACERVCDTVDLKRVRRVKHGAQTLIVERRRGEGKTPAAAHE